MTLTNALTLRCRDCGAPFLFTAQQQASYAQRGFARPPTRCPDCRGNQRGARPRPADGAPDASGHAARCASCGAETVLPFKPRGHRPVYCETCYQARRQGPSDTPPAGEDRDPGAAGPDGAPNPSLESVFPDLDVRPTTRKALAAMGIATPTPIQEQTVPVLLSGRDVIGQARTGSGKTLAFAIPMVERCDPSLRAVQSVVLTPTRELAIQVASVVEALAVHRRVKVTLLYGGRSYEPERRDLRGGAQIVVGTPGRTLDHLRQGSLSFARLRVFVLDEADEMLDRGFARDVEAILAEAPSERQTALFSATMPDWVARTASQHLRNPVTVQVDAHVHAPPEIEHIVYDIDKGQRLAALQTLLDQRGDGPVIVFGRTKHGVKKLAKQLEVLGYPVVALQGNLSQNARERAMEQFRSGQAPILIATNVAARGLDVQGIDRVINFDLPDSDQLFTHRVGRTGRMGRAGEAITFLTDDDMPKWREIERALKRRFPRQAWPGASVKGQAPSSPPADAEATLASRPTRRPALGPSPSRAPRRPRQAARRPAR